MWLRNCKCAVHRQFNCLPCWYFSQKGTFFIINLPRLRLRFDSTTAAVIILVAKHGPTLSLSLRQKNLLFTMPYVLSILHLVNANASLYL